MNPRIGSPGFKRFRPIVPCADSNGALRRLTNAEIVRRTREYGDFSLDQSQLGAQDFYDRMDRRGCRQSCSIRTRAKGDGRGYRQAL